MGPGSHSISPESHTIDEFLPQNEGVKIHAG